MSTRFRTSRSVRGSLLIGILVVAVMFLGRGVLERTLHVLQRPLATAGSWLFAQSVPTDIRTLQNRLASLSVDQVRLQELQDENRHLKETLGFLERQSISTMAAALVSRSTSHDRSLFTLDRGSDHGIQIGDAVFVRDGIFVGKIVEVTSSSATVQALTDPQMATAVGLLGQSQTIGVAEGLLGNLLRLKFIPEETSVRVNDLVVTSGLEPRIPSGLFVGMINDVRPEPNAPFLEAVIEPVVDVRQERLFYVIIEGGL